MNKSTLILRYAFFATLATGMNILTQRVMLFLYTGRFSLPVAMAWGTTTGLLVKFFLDKRFIFSFTPASKFDNAKAFVLYSLMGVATTGIFWLVELLFNEFLAFDGAKYFGAIVGLTVGYTAKYFLDRRFVFHQR